MLRAIACSAVAFSLLTGCQSTNQTTVERNKAIALAFYEDFWFTQNTDRYTDYVAETYVVHDVGERKGVTEAAIEQKNIADMLHSFGEMTGEIDYQIAEATRSRRAGSSRWNPPSVVGRWASQGWTAWRSST